MYQLYYSAGACSMAINVILNELAQPFDLINANQPNSKSRTPEFLKVSPRGYVPILVVDGTPISEGGAIITYLCDTHPSDLMPKSGIARAKALEALMFCNATLHPAYSKAFGVFKSNFDDATKKQVLDAACEGIQKLWNDVEQKLGSQKYLCGDKVTCADILMTVIANWGSFEGRVNLGPNVKRLCAEISSRPAYQKALQAEGVEYKAAA